MKEDTLPQPDVPEERKKEPDQPAEEPSRKRKNLPFGYGLVDDAENGGEAARPEQTPGDKPRDAITHHSAYDILPFADAPPFQPEEPAPHTAPSPPENLAPEQSPSPRSAAEKSSPQPEQDETEDDMADFPGEILEYKIVDPPDDDKDEDNDLAEILPGPTQEVRFDERPQRRPRARRAPVRAQRQDRSRPAPQPAKSAEPPHEEKKKLTPLRIAAILAGAGIVLAILIWLLVALLGG